jgi:hypothetical protein
VLAGALKDTDCLVAQIEPFKQDRTVVPERRRVSKATARKVALNRNRPHMSVLESSWSSSSTICHVHV